MAATGSTEQKLQFEVGKIYLIENHYYHTKSYHEVYVERITEKAYKLRKERANGTWFIEWEERKVFDERNNIIECLDTPMVPPLVSNVDYKIEVNNPEYLKALTVACPICNGTGRVPDDGSTAGDKACPKCFGSGLIYAVE